MSTQNRGVTLTRQSEASEGSEQAEHKTTSSGKRIDHFRSSKLYEDWYYRVGSTNPNDFIIAISANPRTTGVSGTGKTTLALNLAKNYLDVSEDGFDAEQQATLDPHELAFEIYENCDPGSAMIYDEAQGTPSTTGLNAKRAMKDESLNAINTIATRRKDRKTLIIVTQNIKSLVTDLYDYIDAWLLIQDDVNYIATHYGVEPDVFDFESRKTTTPGVEDLSWDSIPKSDADYAYLDELKDQAIQQGAPSSDGDDGRSGLTKEQQAELAQTLRDRGWTLVEIANHEMIDYQRNWVSEHTENPEEKEGSENA